MTRHSGVRDAASLRLYPENRAGTIRCSLLKSRVFSYTAMELMPTHAPAKRLFVALLVSKPVQEEILRFEMAYAKLPVRWLIGKNLHITLVPPWHTDDVEEVKGLLETVEGFAPFELAFTHVTFGPDPRAPRLIWAEGETPTALISLRDRITAALGIISERRSYRLHLTLARFREEQFAAFPVQKLDEPVNWRDTADSFALMESRLARAGADYELLAEFPFKK